MTYRYAFFFFCAALSLILVHCSSDDSPSVSDPCLSVEAIPTYIELEGLLLVEFESGTFDVGWKQVTDMPTGFSNSTGDGYMRYEGENQFNNPGAEGYVSYLLTISTTGTYRFLWHSAVTEGEDPTESNDSFLRFASAADFFGLQGSDSFLYPGGTGKSPNPEGSGSVDGWFKIYRSGTPLDFKWQASTSDNDAHDIYVRFDSPGTYLMEVSGRSRGHAIDKFLLYQEERYTQEEATSSALLATIDCR